MNIESNLELCKYQPTLKDDRGSLTEFCDLEGNYKQVNILHSKKGSIRGNHYHKDLTERFYIVTGLVSLYVKCVHSGNEKKIICEEGEAFVIKPGLLHTLEFLEDTYILSFYSNAFNPKEPDIYTL